jgi:DnaJ-domain-containing protein 1
MALRESLEEAHALSDSGSREAALAALRASADRALDAAMRDLARLLDDESDWAQASGVLQMVMFLDKFRQEIG